MSGGGSNDESHREDAHPDAVRVLTEDFWWPIAEETAPFGNDAGADTLATCREWHRFHEANPRSTSCPRLLEGWEVDTSHWGRIDEASVCAALSQDGFSVMTHDEAVIALFFTEIV